MPETPISLNFTSVFGDASLDTDGYYTFPTGAETWAGFANAPVLSEADAISFPSSRTVTFNAYTTTSVGIRFVFEKNAYPDTDPTYSSNVITINPDQTSYEFTIGPDDLQSPNNTFRSALLFIVQRDISVKVENVVIGAPDASDATPGFKVFKEDLAEWVNPATNNPSFVEWGNGDLLDSYERLTFNDKTFTLGENTYTHIFIQSNGWLQLTDANGSGTSDYTPTISDFLKRPSIAIPWDDYASGGEIHYARIDDQFIIVYEKKHYIMPNSDVKITVTLNMDSHPSKAGSIEIDIGEFDEPASGSSLMGVSYGDQSTPTTVSTIDFTDFTNGTVFAYPSIPVDLLETELATALTLKKITFQRLFSVISVDTTSPVITVTGDNPATIEKGSPYIEVGATASDNVDGDLTSDIVITGTVNTSVVGTYTITYSVTDAAGNTGTATRTVNVVDTTAPIITANLRSTINNGQTSLGSVSSNEPVTWSTNNPDIQIDGQGNVSLQQPANYKEKTSYSFTITATDPSNNVKRVNGNVSVYEVFTPETKDELITALNKWYEIANNN